MRADDRSEYLPDVPADVLLAEPELEMDTDRLAVVLSLMAPYMIGSTGSVEFGSWGWLDLAEDDPARLAAVWRAAFGWLVAVDPACPTPPEVRAVVDREVRDILCAASNDISAAWTEYGLSGHEHVPHHVLAGRRALPTARPGDYPGGPVPVWGADPGRRPA